MTKNEYRSWRNLLSLIAIPLVIGTGIILGWSLIDSLLRKFSQIGLYATKNVKNL